MAARHQRTHQRFAAAIPAQGHRLERVLPAGARRHGLGTQHEASQDTRLAQSCRGVLRQRLYGQSRPCPDRCTWSLKPPTKEKATPLSATPSLRCGATCGARVSRGLAELASLKQLRALIRETLRSSAQPEGVGRAFASLGLAMLFGPSLCSALCLSCPLSLWERVRVRAPGLTNVAMVSIARSPHPSPLPEGEGGNTNAERSDGLLGTRGRAKQRPESPPSGCAEERRGKRDKGRSSLSLSLIHI